MRRLSVTLLHGLLGAPSAWEGLRAALDAEGFQTHVPILPGHGPAPRVLDGLAFDDVARALAAELPSGPTLLVGYSLGGRLALAMAARRPAAIRAVVTIGAHTGITCPEERAERLAWEECLVRSLRGEGIAAFVRRWEALPVFASQAVLPPAILAAQRAVRCAHTEEGIAWAIATLGAGAMPPLLPALRAARVPVVFVVGEADPRARGSADAATAALPSARLHVEPDAGHNVLLERPAAIVALVLAEARALVAALDRERAVGAP